MKPAPRFSLPYPLVYLSAFVLALALRMVLLGALPLADGEAQWAMQALEVVRGTRPQIGVQTGYVLLTSLMFFVFGATNFMARFVPALAGSLLVLVPLLFPERVKPKIGAVLAVMLAIDPGMVAISRQAGSPILAILFFLAAWKLWESRRPQLAGAAAGLALLGGPAVWAGLLGVIIASLLHNEFDTPTREARLRRKENMEHETTRAGDEAEDESAEPVTGSGRTWEWLRSGEFRSALWAAGAAFLLGGSLFLLSPNGLSAAFGSLPAYMTGWWSPSEISIGRLLLALAVYAWPALVLAVMTLVRRVRSGLPWMTRTTWWLFVALLLALVYPGRQVSDLAWMLLPLWILAARELARLLEIPRKHYLELAATLGLMLVFAGYAVFNLMEMSTQDPGSTIPGVFENWRLRLLVGCASLLVATIIPAVIGASWSTRVGRRAAVIGFTTFAAIWMLASATGMSGLRNTKTVELWQADPRIAQVDLLVDTVDSISRWNAGNNNQLPVVLSGTDWPSLRWALRDHKITTAEGIDAEASPAMIISSGEKDFSANGYYAGQDFVWREWVIWDSMTPLSWLNWVFNRSIPRSGENIILWVNTSQFPFQTGQ
jgi:hypothetical protein